MSEAERLILVEEFILVVYITLLGFHNLFLNHKVHKVLHGVHRVPFITRLIPSFNDATLKLTGNTNFIQVSV